MASEVTSSTLNELAERRPSPRIDDPKKRKIEEKTDRYVFVVISHEEGVDEERLDECIWKLPEVAPSNFPSRLMGLYSKPVHHLTLGPEEDENLDPEMGAPPAGMWIRNTLNHFCGDALKSTDVLHGSLIVLCVYDAWLAKPICDCHK
jgi:hypothetical protein